MAPAASGVGFVTQQDETGSVNTVERIDAVPMPVLQLIAAQLADRAHHVRAVAQTFLPLRDRFALSRLESAGRANNALHR